VIHPIRCITTPLWERKGNVAVGRLEVYTAGARLMVVRWLMLRRAGVGTYRLRRIEREKNSKKRVGGTTNDTARATLEMCSNTHNGRIRPFVSLDQHRRRELQCRAHRAVNRRRRTSGQPHVPFGPRSRMRLVRIRVCHAIDVHQQSRYEDSGAADRDPQHQ
jgi:hypothetical protein